MADVKSGETCYLPSLKRAWEMLADVDVDKLAKASGGTVVGTAMSIDVLDGKAIVDPSARTIEVSTPESSIFLEIVVLHYLKGCLESGNDDRGEWLLFRQLPGGETFQMAFQKRVVSAIAERFSPTPTDLVHAGLGLRGEEERFGSATVVLPFLPRLRIRITVWQGDDEVPGNATVLFSPGAERLLPTEDFAVVGSVVYDTLLRSSSTAR